jgi:PAS domain S-box-containing protein
MPSSAILQRPHVPYSFVVAAVAAFCGVWLGANFQLGLPSGMLFGPVGGVAVGFYALWGYRMLPGLALGSAAGVLICTQASAGLGALDVAPVPISGDWLALVVLGACVPVLQGVLGTRILARVLKATSLDRGSDRRLASLVAQSLAMGGAAIVAAMLGTAGEAIRLMLLDAELPQSALLVWSVHLLGFVAAAILVFSLRGVRRARVAFVLGLFGVAVLTSAALESYVFDYSVDRATHTARETTNRLSRLVLHHLRDGFGTAHRAARIINTADEGTGQFAGKPTARSRDWELLGAPVEKSVDSSVALIVSRRSSKRASWAVQRSTASTGPLAPTDGIESGSPLGLLADATISTNGVERSHIYSAPRAASADVAGNNQPRMMWATIVRVGEGTGLIVEDIDLALVLRQTARELAPPGIVLEAIRSTSGTWFALSEAVAPSPVIRLEHEVVFAGRTVAVAWTVALPMVFADAAYLAEATFLLGVGGAWFFTVLIALLMRERLDLKRTVDEQTQGLASARRDVMAILDSSPDATLITARDGTIERANSQALDMLGYASHELIGQSVDVLVPAIHRGSHGVQRESFFRVSEARLMGSGLELYAQRSDGRRMAVDIRISPLRIDGQELAMAVIRDVTHVRRTEQLLRSQEAQLQAAIDSFGGGVASLDSARRLILWNDTFSELLGVDDRDSLEGRPIRDVLGEIVGTGQLGAEEGGALAARLMQRAQAKDSAVRTIAVGDRKLRTSQRIASDDSLILTVIDVTADEALRDELRGQWTFLNEVLSTVNQGVIAFDNERRLRTWNRRYVELFVLSPDLLRPGTPIEVISRAIRAGGQTPEASARTEARLWIERLFSGGPCIWEHSHAGRHLDCRSEPAADGGIVLTFTDITERREVESLMTLQGLGTRIANESQEAREAIGRCLESVCAHTRWEVAHALEVIHGAEGPRLVSTGLWHAAIDTVETQSLAASVAGVDAGMGEGLSDHVLDRGAAYWIEDLGDLEGESRGELLRRNGFRAVLGVPVFVDGQARAVLEFAMRSSAIRDDRIVRVLEHIGSQIAQVYQRQDVTEQLQAARVAAEAASVAKAQFLANTSHEIRTPMNAVIGLTQLALSTNLDDRQRDYISKAYSAARNLLGVINDILDFSKMESGQLELEATPFAVDRVVRNLADICGLRAEEKGLEFLILVPEEMPEGLMGDPLRLGQILLNLCNNAIKFTGEGHVAVSMTVLERSERDVVIRFAVDDTGEGMGSDAQSRLFRPFSQADSSITRQFGGTGLGLVISRELVEKMGGRIGVYSELGLGSSFWFTARFGLVGSAVQRRFILPEDLHGSHVLVVDANQPARETLTGYLESLDTRPVGCATLDQAERIITRAGETSDSSFSLAMLDRKSLNGDFEAAVARLKAAQPEQLRVIALSATGSLELLDDTRETGIDADLSKPVTRSSIFDSVLEVFERVDAPARTAALAIPELPARLAGARVLLVEDNLVNQQVARELLEHGSLNVVVAGNGQEALDILETAATFDCVLMDLQMPVLDGLTATRRLRAHARFNELPIIAMTANVTAGDRERTLEAGMQDHVGKPISVGELYAALCTWIPRTAEQAANVPVRAIARTAPHDVVPIIKGVDTAAAVARVGGSLTAYRSILMLFCDDQAGTGQAILKAIATGDPGTARGLAHTLKGVAANVGADALHQATIELEVALNAVDADPRPMAKKVTGVLETVVSDIRHHLGARQPETMVITSADGDCDVRCRTLVVDDNPVNRRVVSGLLASLGERCDEAGDGREALRVWRTKRHSVVLTDLRMPVLDGLALVKAIRRESSPGEVCVVGLSGDSAQEATCLGAGMDFFSTKPIPADFLMNVFGLGVPGVTEELDAALMNPVPGHGAASSQTTKPLDRNALRLMFDDDAVVQEILAEFRTSARAIVNDLCTAAGGSDASGVSEAAHKLASAARTVGANDLAALCQSAEEGATVADEDGLIDASDAIARELNRVEGYLNDATEGDDATPGNDSGQGSVMS